MTPTARVGLVKENVNAMPSSCWVTWQVLDNVRCHVGPVNLALQVISSVTMKTGEKLVFWCTVILMLINLCLNAKWPGRTAGEYSMFLLAAHRRVCCACFQTKAVLFNGDVRPHVCTSVVMQAQAAQGICCEFVLWLTVLDLWSRERGVAGTCTAAVHQSPHSEVQSTKHINYRKKTRSKFCW